MKKQFQFINNACALTQDNEEMLDLVNTRMKIASSLSFIAKK
jgi:hypothetical protein